jgi:hypothetical protein
METKLRRLDTGPGFTYVYGTTRSHTCHSGDRGRYRSAVCFAAGPRARDGQGQGSPLHSYHSPHRANCLGSVGGLSLVAGLFRVQTGL